MIFAKTFEGGFRMLIEKLFGTELKIKILRVLNQKKRANFNEIRDLIQGGAGSTKNALEQLVRDGILLVENVGKLKKVFSISEEYTLFLNTVFQLEDDYIRKTNLSKKLFEFFGELKNYEDNPRG